MDELSNVGSPDEEGRALIEDNNYMRRYRMLMAIEKRTENKYTNNYRGTEHHSLGMKRLNSVKFKAARGGGAIK